MPRKGITAYDILISCPGDVIEYVKIISECVENFNKLYGALNNIQIVTKHWSTDSYPESGNTPQELLNKQIVKKSDAVIAIFGTKFGTPTEKYGSGTEEEIEVMFSDNKQVFMYFLDVPVNPSQIDSEQYRKVIEFKDKFKSRAIYAEVKDKDEFKRQFSTHLALYFLSLISDGNISHLDIPKPILHIRDINSRDRLKFTMHQMDIGKCKFLSDKIKDITNQIESLNSTVLPQAINKSTNNKGLGVVAAYQTSDNYPNQYGAKNLLGQMMQPVVITNEWIITITNYCEEAGINLDDHFWSVGDLKIQNNQFNISFLSAGPSLGGTDSEKERYSLIKELYWNIKELNEYKRYFEYLDKLNTLELAICNVGKAVDEDIDVKIIIPKGCIYHLTDLPYPGMNIIKELLESKFLESVLLIQGTEDLKTFEYSSKEPFKISSYRPMDPFNQYTDLDNFEYDKQEYKDKLDSIYLYQTFKSNDSDILTFRVEYLKHNVSMTFPSILMFLDKPSTIEYEITSKHVSDAVKGKLELFLE